jgi:hypothetical protein
VGWSGVKWCGVEWRGMKWCGVVYVPMVAARWLRVPALGLVRECCMCCIGEHQRCVLQRPAHGLHPSAVVRLYPAMLLHA